MKGLTPKMFDSAYQKSTQFSTLHFNFLIQLYKKKVKKWLPPNLQLNCFVYV